MSRLQARRTELNNWGRSARSVCQVYPAHTVDEIALALAEARAQHLSVIPHGAGHSYTDAALNTGGVVMDLTPLRRILAWDAQQGVMRVEPGVTLRQMVQVAGPDGWRPVVSPSTAEVTIGGCAAMNVNGKNAWKCGPFGAHILALEVLLTTGDRLTLTRERDTPLLRAFVGSLGLLGIITALTVQLERVVSGEVVVRRRSARSLAELLALFAAEEAQSDFMEAWLDGFAAGRQLGRGHLTSAHWAAPDEAAPGQGPGPAESGRLASSLLGLAGRLNGQWLLPAVPLANRIYAWRASRGGPGRGERQTWFAYTYWPATIFTGYHALLPGGVETFQAFVPRPQAGAVFAEALRYSQQHGCWPIWCVLKQHRADPFLLSYQVDGFSLELNYARAAQPAATLEPVLRYLLAAVLEAGGRFYLAKDRLLTGAQYRRSLGDEAIDTFLGLKQRYDPDGVLQSDLFRRVFAPAA